jgi:hypothetical protein
MMLRSEEIRFSRLSLVDIGRVFWWQGRVFRAILPGAAPNVEKLFRCGLVDRLVSAGLLVGSRLTDYQLEGFDLIIEHDAIPVPTYPREWSFTMLKDAGLLVLALNDIARQFGFQTKDCNGYNVLFRDGKPIYVDLGSFVEVPIGEDVLLPYEEFLRSYVYPLIIWRSAGQHLGTRVVPRAVGLLLAQESYLRFRWPVLRRVGDARLRAWWRRISFVRTLRHQHLCKRQGRVKPWVLNWLRIEKKNGWLRGPARIGRLRRRIESLTHDTGASLWANYHDSFNHGPELQTTPRFSAVVERLAALNVRSMLEIAGNQGVLSRLLSYRLPAARVICTDPDGLAVDKGYVANKQAGSSVEWAVVNPFASESSPAELSMQDRFRSDAVVVLALTHHLTLSHNFRLDFIFEVIASFSKRYVFIEFMPLGLHDGTSAPPLPDWYGEAWFHAEFCRHFELVERTQLEDNRVLFIGETLHAAC